MTTHQAVNVRQLLDLTGRVAIITGGSMGLGRQMAEGLAEMGANLVLCARKKERCESAAEELRLEQWNKVLETNLTGTFLCSQAVGKVMMGQKRGKIINVASIAGMVGSPPELQAIGYSASKGGVITFTRDLARKWAGHNIHVNAIAPGWFPTHMSGGVIERNRENLLKSIPLGRFGSEDDLKGAAVFLASSASDFVTGQVLVVDGGQTA